jgi:hypothetical protein
MAKQQKQTTSMELSLAMSCAVTGTVGAVTKIPSSSTLSEKIGMRIRSIHYYLGDTWMNQMLTAMIADMNFGLSFLAAQPATGFAPTSPGVIDHRKLVVNRSVLTAVGVDLVVQDMPMISDMTLKNEGGVLVHPASLYNWYYNVNAWGVGPLYIYMKIFYTLEDISQDTWDEMWKQMFVTQAP